ncbi:MAG: hypothetical protein AAF799_03515 [Myxococcota bacterium]
MDSPPPFSALPLDEQLRQLEAALERGEDPRQLLRTCAGVRDHAPLAWLARRLLERDWLRGEDERAWTAGFLLEQPETAVDRVLKAWVGDGSFTKRRGDPLQDTLLAVLQQVGVDRVSVMCLVDRALKHNFSEARDAHVEALTARCAEALAAGRVDDVGIDQLAQVSSPGIATLRARAAEHGPQTAEALHETLKQLARRTLEVLGQAPKAVSQANAEELLSKRVYTDPGHFLVELLQNAEDAGARTFRLRFGPRRIEVWHDGKPFDTRDVVGVTSIGQTTKRKQQIGFFGVGFKSIYEITDRPQIYSDVYCFEIADVSIPKSLAGRPSTVSPDGTVLVLPLRAPDDPERSPEQLFGKARDLDAIVLFTLRRIDVIDLELEAADGTITKHSVHELAPDERGVSRIRQQPQGWVRGYAVHDAEHVYRGGLRAPGRADRTRVMVGVRVDEEGVPRALEPDTPTVYSYLPTEEHSGLRFFVQGHFDVPVDRERVTQDSRWNEWILSMVPQGLASLAEQLTADLPVETRARVAEGFLGVLPLMSELGSPIFRRIVLGLRAAFASMAIVPCEDGSLQPAASILHTEEELAALYEGEPVRLDGTVRYLALRQLPPRAIEVASMLGASRLRVGDLVDELDRCLSECSDGSRSEDSAAPIFLREPTSARLAACYEVLDGAVMRRTGAGPRRLADLSTMRRLRALPLVLSEREALYRPGSAIVRADPALREIYEGLRAFVHPDHDAAVDPEDPARATTTAFLERLGVHCLSVRDLVDELHSQLGSRTEPIADLAQTRFPGTPQRLAAAIALLAEASTPLQRRAARLPIFAARDGRYYPAARSPSDRNGVLLYEPGGIGTALLEYYGHERPVCAPDEDDPALSLLQSARTPALSLVSLVADLRDRAPSLDDDALERLHALLETLQDEVPDRTRRELAKLPIWPDTHGVRRPLIGDDAVRIPASPAIAALLPALPLLHPRVLARTHAREMGGDVVGIEALLDALAPEAEAPLRIEPTPASVTAVLEILREDKDSISPRMRARLVEVPAFLDDTNTPCRLDQLALAEDASLRQVYAHWPARRFVDPESLSRTAITELDLDGRLTRAKTETLVDDLAGVSAQLAGRVVHGDSTDEPLPFVHDGEHLRSVLQYCAARATALPRAALLRLCQVAIIPDTQGALGLLGDARRPDTGSEVYACAPSLRPTFSLMGSRILAPWADEILGPLLEAAGREALDIVALVARLKALPPVAPSEERAPAQTPEALAIIHQALVEGASVLAHHHPPEPRPGLAPSSRVLGALAIWPTRAGGVTTAEHVVDDDALQTLLPTTGPARQRLKAATLDPEATVRLRALAPLVVPTSASHFVAELVEAMARPGLPLHEQDPMLSDPLRLAQLYAFIGPDAPVHPAVDSTGRLRLHPLVRALPDTVALAEGTDLAERLLHPAMATALPEDLPFDSLRPDELVGALIGDHLDPGPMQEHPRLTDAKRRQRFYAWLVDHESAVFTDPDARVRLRSQPLFPTDRGTLRSADQLVVDPDLPQLDVDWTPHPELPAQTLSLLVRHLGIGRPPVEDLVADHLAPAYRTAAARGDGPGAARLLEYLARSTSSVPGSLIQALISIEGPALVEGSHGHFVDATGLLLPPTELVTAVESVFGTNHPPPHPRLTEATHGLLRTLGVPSVPPHAWVAEAMRAGVASVAAASGLALLVAYLHRDDPEGTLEQLPLTEVPWLLDGNGITRRPSALFHWTAEVQALVGEDPSLYPAPQISRIVGEALMARLGLRNVSDVRLPEVVAHIDASRKRSAPVPFRVYQWLERGLVEGWLDGAQLRASLSDRAWICSDDGEYHPHARVLGVRALEQFGQRRGYWERGRQQCPALCRIFAIATQVDSTALLAFLEEVAHDARLKGDASLLADEPALPRMLLRAYAALGADEEAQAGGLVLCRQCGGEDSGALALRPFEDPLVLRSDAPALEAMFSAAGTFFVAAPGSLEDRAAIDSYYQRGGLARLRETYEVEVVDDGEDLGTHYPEPIAALRVTLRALLSTLPRVQLQRTHLSSEAWVHTTRLAPLARAGSIRVRAGLEVDYVLPRVGRARAQRIAVYDPSSRALLVDTRVLMDPAGTVTGLAQGLMACIYDGPGEDQLVDIVEILLRLRSRERMDDYLDQRFFPTADEGDQEPGNQLAARVGELFDYGLDRRLVARFEALAGRSLDRWRDPAVFADLPDDQEQAVRTVVGRMLAAIELEDAPQPLVEALALLLSARSLSDVPAGLLAPQAQRLEPNLSDEVGPRPASHRPEGRSSASAPSAGDAGGSPLQFDSGPSSFDPDSDDIPSLAELEARLAELTGQRDGSALGDDASPHRFVIPSTTEPSGTAFPIADGDDREPEPVHDPLDAPAPEQSGGFWQRMARRLGLTEPTHEEPPPAWAEPGANVLGPSSHIGPQLWVRGHTLREMATQRVPMGLLHQPQVLPSPYRYVVHTLGVIFDRQSQRWHPQSLPGLSGLYDGERTGATVSFAGSLSPGRSVIPVPLFGDIVRMEVVDANPKLVRPLGRIEGGSAVVEVDGGRAIDLRYEVELRRPPTLTESHVEGWPTPRPTVPRHELPRPVRDWIDRNAIPERCAWEQARRAEAFVQRNYLYDLEFRERPEVERAARDLRPGVGNHHLTLLHASADAQTLGRGVCYELNVLVAELLRHLGVPTMIATGWMLDEGFADRPDHLFALAVLPSAAGPCLMPLDAATGPRGPVRPLAGSQPPTVDLSPRRRPSILEPGGGWGGRMLPGPEREVAVDEHVHSFHRLLRDELDRERDALYRLLRIAEAARGTEPTPRRDDEQLSDLRARAIRALGDPARLAPMLAIIRGDYDHTEAVPDVVQALVRDGLATVQSRPSYRVRPADENH